MKKTLSACNLLLILALVCFIWWNSSLPGADSAQISRGILSRLLDMFPFLSFTEKLLRKMGHFLEFAALGFLLANFVRLLGERGLHHFTLSLLPGILTAMTDETIQMFVEGRSSEVRDVWIDTAGCVFGILFLLLIAKLFLKGNKRI